MCPDDLTDAKVLNYKYGLQLRAGAESPILVFREYWRLELTLLLMIAPVMIGAAHEVTVAAVFVKPIKLPIYHARKLADGWTIQLGNYPISQFAH